MKRSRISTISSSSEDEVVSGSAETDGIPIPRPAPALFGKPLISVPKPVAITVTTISSSSVSSNVTPKMMFASASAALETKTTSVIISHNHPHGVALPSREDVAITQKAFDLLKSLKVKLSDHIILTETTHFSMVSTIQFANIFYDLPSP